MGGLFSYIILVKKKWAVLLWMEVQFNSCLYAWYTYKLIFQYCIMCTWIYGWELLTIPIIQLITYTYFSSLFKWMQFTSYLEIFSYIQMKLKIRKKKEIHLTCQPMKKKLQTDIFKHILWSKFSFRQKRSFGIYLSNYRYNNNFALYINS